MLTIKLLRTCIFKSHVCLVTVIYFYFVNNPTNDKIVFSVEHVHSLRINIYIYIKL